MRPVTKIEQLSLLVSGLAILAMGAEILLPVERRGVDENVALSNQVDVVTAVPTAGALVEYRVIVDRFLFHPERKKLEPQPEVPQLVEAAEVEIDERPSRTHFDLDAVLIADGIEMALVRIDGSELPQRVRTGETIEGWELVEMSPTSITLASVNSEQEIELFPENEN